MRRQLGALSVLLVALVAAPAGGLNMLDGVKKLLLKRDSAFLYQEKALFMPGANAKTEATAKTACASGDRAAILRAVDDLEAVCVADDFLDTDAARLDGRWRLLATVAASAVVPATVEVDQLVVGNEAVGFVSL